MAQGHPTAAAMASYTRSRLPFARPQTLQTLQNPPNPPKPSKPSKSPASSAGKRYPNKPNTRHSRTQKPPQGHSNGSRAPHGRSNGFFYRRSRLPFARPQTLQTLRPTCATLARKSHHKATAMAQEHPTAAAMASYRRSRLPFARPQTLHTLQDPPKVRPAPQGKGTPTSPTRATAARKSHHKATAMAQGHPTAAAMASYFLYTRSRLPFARPQTLQTLQNPPNPPRPSKSPASSAGKRYPNKPNTRHSRTQKPPQGHSNGSRAPHGRSNGFFYRRSRLPFARPQTLQTIRPTCATLARKSHHKATAMAQGHPTAAAMASYFLYVFKAAVWQASKPSKPSKTLQTLQKSGQLRREKVPQQAQHAPLPHAKATTRPQQWLKSTTRPQQWLLL